MKKNIELIKNELDIMNRAKDILEYSYKTCSIISIKDTYLNDELDKFEALTSRFARLSDILTQKIFRLIEYLEMESPGTVRDRINRAEKWGLIDKADDFFLIRELRNSIAHEFLPEAINQIYREVLKYTPVLFKVCDNVTLYIKRFF
ncbi:MAG: hypothetical protein DRP57_06635 [Spirochaetes bacterium]|nr:MAG: hypothetical protein DRP57_06635 [Spirochaetota bacterium]